MLPVTSGPWNAGDAANDPPSLGCVTELVKPVDAELESRTYCARLPTWLITSIVLIACVRFAFVVTIGVGELPDSSRYLGSIGAFGGWSALPTLLYTVVPFGLGVAIQAALISALWAWSAWIAVTLSRGSVQRIATLIVVFATSAIPSVLQWDWFKMTDGLLIGAGMLMLVSLARCYQVARAPLHVWPWRTLVASLLLMSLSRPSSLLFSLPLAGLALAPLLMTRRARELRDIWKYGLAIAGIVIVAGLLAYDTSNYWKGFQANNRLMYRGDAEYLEAAVARGMPECESLESRSKTLQSYGDRLDAFDPLPVENCPREVNVWLESGGLSPLAEAASVPVPLVSAWGSALMEIQYKPLILSDRRIARIDEELGLESAIPAWLGNSMSERLTQFGILAFQGLVALIGTALLLFASSYHGRLRGLLFLATTQAGLWLYMFTSYWFDPMEIQRHALPASVLIPLSFWLAGQVARSGDGGSEKLHNASRTIDA